jgi:hypothetical protein
MHNFISDFVNSNSNSDKLTNHGYQRIYPWFLSHFKTTDVNLLEIGVADSESLKLWKNYFEKVNLYAIDILPLIISDVKVNFSQLDQSSERELLEFANNLKVKFDIIIDDGSHVPDHQMLTLLNLWETLKDGGVYIIEDIETSYWGKSFIYGYKFNSYKRNPIVILLDVISFINFKFLTDQRKIKLEKSIYNELFKSIEMITFGHNCIVLTKKDQNSFSNFYNETYIRKLHINDRTLFRSIKSKFKFYYKLLINRV